MEKQMFKEVSAVELRDIRERFPIENENLHKRIQSTRHHFLDIFETPLSEDDISEIENYYSPTFTHEHEAKFLAFFKHAFELNNNLPVIVDIELRELESWELIEMLNTLDQREQVLFMDNIRNFKPTNKYFKIDKLDLLLLVAKLAVREHFDSIIFNFQKLPMTIAITMANVLEEFEDYAKVLSYPVFIQNENHDQEYNKLAVVSDLHLIES